MVRAAATALIALLLQAAPGLAQDRLAPGHSQTVVLNDADGVRLSIDAPAGSYLAGRIDAKDVPVNAELQTSDGRHHRQLARDDGGTTAFHAMTEGTSMFVRLTGRPGATVTVTLDRLVPPAAQVAPPTDHLSPRIAELAQQLQNEPSTEAFWRDVARSGTPMVEPGPDGQSVVTFLWRGASRNVRLFGAPSNDHEWLDRLGSSDIWFKSFLVPDDTRLSYRLAPDVPDLPGDARARRVALLATAQADPLNRAPWPATAPDRFNQQSTLTLPKAPPQPGTPPDDNASPVIDHFIWDSAAMGNGREITLSQPRDLDPRDPDLIVAVIFDGKRAIAEMDAPRMLDSLSRQGRLPPVLAVFVPSIDSETRARELPGNDRFADALADELIAAVATRTGISINPARTVLAGASYGGLAAATVAMRRPETFGNVLSMSGSFWWSPPGSDATGIPHVASLAASQPKQPIRFFLSAGSFETARQGSGGILETSLALRDVLRLRGYGVQWREYAGGHDYLVWRGALPDGLIALFGS